MKLHWRATTLVVAVVCASGWVPLPSSAASMHLHRGSQGPLVRTLELRLHQLHLLGGAQVDRRYRRPTVRAVRQFQRQLHLRPTGKVGLRTWNLVASEARRRTAGPRRPAPPPAPTILGHRGARVGTLPENTMTSMRYAATRADVLEFDLRLTADRQFVLMHDDTLDRTTTCTGRVRDRTAADLRANCLVDQHGASEPVPTFDEVTAYARRASKRIAPELNDAGLGSNDLAAADAVVRAHGWSSRTYLQSFYPAYFAGLRAVDRALTFVYLADRPTAPAAVRASGATIAGLKLAGLTSTTVATFHRARVRVWAWTAADAAQLKTLWDLRVDGVVTDVPATARRMYHPG